MATRDVISPGGPAEADVSILSAAVPLTGEVTSLSNLRREKMSAPTGGTLAEVSRTSSGSRIEPQQLFQEGLFEPSFTL